LLVFFVVGLAVGYGLAYLDGQTRVPRLEPTEVFTVVFPDGTFRHLSYAEVERERAELRLLRQHLARREEPRPSPASAPPSTEPPGQGEEEPAPPSPRPSAEASAEIQESSRKKVGDLFAKLFSKPVMREIALSQARRQAGELSAVLGLTDEQRKSLETELERRKQELAQGRGTPPSAGPAGSPRGERDLEDLVRNLLTPEQYRRYETYTERKKEIGRAPVPDQELFELTWRLDLNEEQEVRASEILKAQWEKIQQLSPMAGSEDETSPLDQFQRYLDKRDEIVSRSTEQFKSFLDEDQLPGYLQYVSEKEMETHLLQKMIRSEAPDGSESPP